MCIVKISERNVERDRSCHNNSKCICVYMKKKRRMWEKIIEIKSEALNKVLYVTRDFNIIRNVEKGK